MNDKRNIFIVDDNIAYCEAMRFLLELIDDVNVHTYVNATDFLNSYTSNMSGCLLMDLFMPGIDGIKLLEILKTIPHQLYIIMISGHADQSIEAKIKDMGANEFILKPFDTNQLINKIKSLL